LLPATLFAAYLTAAAVAGVAPADRGAWLLTSILPAAFVGCLAMTRRRLPLSDASYALIAVFLGMHTVGSHYTYAHVPLGLWVNDALGLGRNPFDRVVHFAFGLLLTYPAMELCARWIRGGRTAIGYVAAMTCIGLSGLWEILEAWVAQLVDP
jgi:putative membrane protein